MKKFILLLTLLLLPMQALAADHELPQIDTSQYELSGDAGLACKAILCLSSGERPGECGPALSSSMRLSTARAVARLTCSTASSGNGKLSESVSPTMSGGK